MIYLSKSKYCGLWQCPKIAWLRKYKPEEWVLDDGTLARMDAGNEVGDLAMGLFGDFVEVTAYTDGKLDLQKMMDETEAEMAKGTPIICEASFSYNGLYCAVDILRKAGDGWAIYEVKSSSRSENEKEDKLVYIADIAYQKYVLEHCGVNVTGTYLVQLNKEYVFDGTLDINKLFIITDVADSVALESGNIEPNLEIAEELLNCPDEPAIDLNMGCKKPYVCGFWNYCSKHLPNQSVFNLYRMRFKDKLDYYHRGLISYESLRNNAVPLNSMRSRQVDFALNDMGAYVNKEAIRKFLGTLSYPLYFLDFETMQLAIPQFVGTRPYAQITFQYSLHYIEHEGGELKHKECLAESGTDPRRLIAERLCEDIPKDVCVTAYNKSFECGRLRELAGYYPDLADHLLNIESNIVDLIVPFQSGWYYNRAMGGSFSIKSVLPALFPDDPELDYHNLEGIHNGGEAMIIFPKIQYMEPEEQKKTRENLLKYCQLDTYAMVKVWEDLKRVAE